MADFFQGNFSLVWISIRLGANVLQTKFSVTAQFLPGILDAKDLGHFPYQSAHGKEVVCVMFWTDY